MKKKPTSQPVHSSESAEDGNKMQGQILIHLMAFQMQTEVFLWFING